MEKAGQSVIPGMSKIEKTLTDSEAASLDLGRHLPREIMSIQTFYYRSFTSFSTLGSLQQQTLHSGLQCSEGTCQLYCNVILSITSTSTRSPTTATVHADLTVTQLPATQLMWFIQATNGDAPVFPSSKTIYTRQTTTQQHYHHVQANARSS